MALALPFAVQQMKPEKVEQMLREDPQAKQMLTDKPRVGFTHNPYKPGLGKLFQNTIKNTLLEKLIEQVWQGFMRYRCHGDNGAYRAGLKEPDKVFVYDDAFLTFLNTQMKRAIREYNSDNDADRKIRIQSMLTDIVMTMLFEDIYYRARSKLMLRDLVEECKKNPDLLRLTNHEAMNYIRFSNFNCVDGFHNPEMLKSIEPLKKLLYDGKGGDYYEGEL